jgi:tryptophan synthase alpha subunit
MKLQTILIGATVVAGVMAFSNPSKERYVDYATEYFAETGRNSLCSADMPSAAQQSCKFVISQGKSVIKPYIENSSKQQNLVLFSIYTTELPSKKSSTIGAFGNFFRLN